MTTKIPSDCKAREGLGAMVTIYSTGIGRMPYIRLYRLITTASIFNGREKDFRKTLRFLNMSTNGVLAALEYDKNYYEEHKREGLDYLGHGYWQESYARMVSDATLQNTYPSPRFFDGGCACGSILQGFKKTGLYQQVLGIDLSEHMTTLGRHHFNFLKTEILAGSIDNIPLKDNTVTLVHSAQVLEHIPDEKIDSVLKEFARILVPGGRAFLCLDAVRHGESKEQYMGDPTHCNVKPVAYWTKKLFSLGLAFDVESYDRYARSKYGPTQGVDMSFFQHYPSWSAWTLIKLN